MENLGSITLASKKYDSVFSKITEPRLTVITKSVMLLPFHPRINGHGMSRLKVLHIPSHKMQAMLQGGCRNGTITCMNNMALVVPWLLFPLYRSC